jgi:heterodisulfide reductase subunit C
MLVQDEVREKEFMEELVRQGGEQLRDFIRACYQCGTCSGGCPTSYAMDFTPRQIVRMVQFGMQREVLSSLTLWLCASCFSCVTSCPRRVEIPRLMYTLKNIAIKRGVAAKAAPEAWFYLSFLSILSKYGRMNEFELMKEFKSREGLLKAALEEGLPGLKLLLRGKFKLRPERIRQMEHMEVILGPVREGLEEWRRRSRGRE